MSDIQPGDVVVCVAGKFSSCPNRSRHLQNLTPTRRAHVSGFLIVGRHYTVTGIAVKHGEVGLYLAGSPHGFCAGRFRKIRPADEQFTQSIRATKPVREDA